MNFNSFFMAGFECATGFNCRRQKVDQVSATQHDRFLTADYRRLKRIGISTVREGVRWPNVDQGGSLDLSELRAILAAANRYRIELILDLFHYGYPSALDIFSNAFCDRFANYCRAVAEVVEGEAALPVHFTPVNEPSYFAWVAGEAARYAPYLTGRAYDIKVACVRAAIAGIEAIWSVLPDARIVNVDPLCRVAAPMNDSSRDDEIRFFNDVAVFESWDMLAGRTRPELGGSPKHLDIVGVNYYWTNQWEIGRTDEPLSMDDPRLVPLKELLEDVWKRYERPLIISETSHVDLMRGPWLRYVAGQVASAIEDGIPVKGICIYPVLGMPEWHEPTVWTRMGLWNCVPGTRGRLIREPDEPVLKEYLAAAAQFGQCKKDAQYAHTGISIPLPGDLEA